MKPSTLLRTIASPRPKRRSARLESPAGDSVGRPDRRVPYAFARDISGDAGGLPR